MSPPNRASKHDFQRYSHTFKNVDFEYRLAEMNRGDSQYTASANLRNQSEAADLLNVSERSVNTRVI